MGLEHSSDETGQQLTPDRRGVSVNVDVTIDKGALLARWLADAEALQTEYPQFEVILDIRLRKNEKYQMELETTDRVEGISVSELPREHEPPAVLEELDQADGLAPSDFTDDEWQLLVQALPPDAPGMKTERGIAGTRRVLNGMFYRHHYQTVWTEVPRRYGSFEAIQVRHSNYKTRGIFARTLAALDGTPGAERLVEWLRHVEGERPTTSSQRDDSAA